METGLPHLLAFAALVVAMLSLASFRRFRDDLVCGRPHHSTLALYSGRFRREELEQLVGPVDDDDRYAIPSERVLRLPRRGLGAWTGSTYDDLGCCVLALAALRALPVDPTLGGLLAGLCAVWMLIGLVLGVHVIWIMVNDELAQPDE